MADDSGHLRGVPAVIDKDFASGLLASNIEADLFMISTAVEKVALHFGKPGQRWLDQMSLDEARTFLAEGVHFAKGSMAPKIEAAIKFLENGGQRVIITDPEHMDEALAGRTGTHMHHGSD